MNLRTLGAAAVFGIVASVPGSVAFAASACSVPLSYSLGSIDPRFGITKQQVVDDLAQAEAIWEAPTKHDLYAYATTSGKVRVNFVYDARQAETDSEKATLTKLDAIHSVFDTVRTQFDHVSSSTVADQTANVADFAAYKSDQDKLNADIEASNARGGATPVEYQAYLDRQSALRDRFVALKATESSINDRIARLNTLLDLINQLTDGVNGYITRYNAALATGQEYEQGEYVQDGSLRTVTIYQYADATRLVRALAHELGHAIGLQHVTDKNAIMYRANEGTTLAASTADIQALDLVCGF